MRYKNKSAIEYVDDRRGADGDRGREARDETRDWLWDGDVDGDQET